MSYLVLARKSRPTNFDEVVGQGAVVKTLRNSILRQRIAHAILFSGVRGVGKTTLARIMAKAINCEAEPEQRPCNKCRSCRDIAEGRSLDIIEIDGASNNGVDNVRDLRENVKVLPTSSRCRVVIIDEVHMLSISAFNALLKTLEEPPDHVHFMFATTEIHKVPITILSRCQQYELKKVPARELIAHFKKLVEGEGFSIEEPALAIIARESGGSVRDGLSLLEQLFSFGEKEITSDDVVEMLGLAGQEILLQLTRALLSGDRPEALAALHQVFAFGVDLRRFVEDLLNCFRSLLLLSMRGCEGLVELADMELDDYTALARSCTTETLHLKLNQLLAAAEALQHSSQPRLTLETSMLKIIEAGNVVPISALLGQLERILPQMEELGELKTQAVASQLPETPLQPQSQGDENTPGKKSEPPAAEAPPEPVQEPLKLEQPAPSVLEPAPEPAPQPEPPPVPQPEPEPASETVPVPESDQPPEPPVSSSCSDITECWKEYLAKVEEEVPWMDAVLQKADGIHPTADGDGCHLEIHYDEAATCSILAQPENVKVLEQLAVDFFHKTITVSIHSEEEVEGDENSPRAIRKRLSSNPKVRLTTEVFLGQVGEIRLKK